MQKKTPSAAVYRLWACSPRGKAVMCKCGDKDTDEGLQVQRRYQCTNITPEVTPAGRRGATDSNVQPKPLIKMVLLESPTLLPFLFS